LAEEIKSPANMTRKEAAEYSKVLD